MSDTATRHIDQKLFKEVTGHYPTGVAVVTGRAADGELLALVVGTFSSVSLAPPLVSFMPMKTSRTYERMRECTSLCINIVGGAQEREVMTIAQRWEKKFDGIEWFPSPSGDPVLADSVAWIDTKPYRTVEAGDHWIALCEVTAMAVTNPVTPLIFFQGGYGSFVCTSLMARMDHEILPAIHMAHSARADVEGLASRIGCEASVLTAISSDEMAVVLSATAPGLNRESSLAQRVPMVPPIGDTYVFNLPSHEQDRWIAKLRNCDDEQAAVLRGRLDFVRQHGYLASFLPSEGASAYAEMREATRTFESGRMTPAQERQVRESIRQSRIDYRARTFADDEKYDVGSLVLPVRDHRGTYSLTLRLAHLPQRISGSEIAGWLSDARSVVRVLEKAGMS
ncbi:flavin reductase (DIM6/NTAB) family NADH-FMN oxidoreductase RutF/DNA-binding IclR family transcriptional regulator [Mycobacterium frederiksbergense]|uniref:Flavin reductase (DIM6/NTAB) family NADH-FMN oxidoreductase RutF/DNA-binding IclR family transcriptional regulator n=1 Tax=Mycolicibacterium frederiksbergense TaxID=117567 RepID=A0ABT6KVI1_9MYCO|nr:flavin reductase family protein [Mycolicibacterium frederiksbergense]MDH6194674.1 flavin reductase (DIM6/NTAB) family NADH-FMN oxidoreductase RutF/DNA-binding IclR family transcriptional regulator [Mycolicibacterium frederiksbergense]